ncbi:DUF3137 domain-containing protein [Demequina globuliformis]|uniref:DUF3137 domain-containing protein n=1 Tax=Demequina globuliformis TaxID=676202 RepID=UPI000784A173|nr:DUF3137 domain-containing protein [Demequina globuliformis]
MTSSFSARRWGAPAVMSGLGLAGFFGFSGSAVLMGVALGLLAIGLIWLAFDVWSAARHSDDYRRFARDHGWDYTAQSGAYTARFRGYPFDSGATARQESVVTGTFNGMPCATFVHAYEPRRDDNSPALVVPHQVTAAELDVNLPRIDLMPEGIGQAVASVVGGGDLDTESHDFNRLWRVICDDDRYARSLLDPRMIERLTWADAVGKAIRIEGSAVYVWEPGRVAPKDLAARLSLVTGIARRIPDHVLREFRDLGYGSGRHDVDGSGPMPGPAWAAEGGVLNGRRYTGVGVDADGDGIEDAQVMRG